MIITKLVDIGVANLCCASATPGHVETFGGSKDGHSTQLTYVADGGGWGRSEDGLIEIQMTAGSVVDMEPLMGSQFVGTVTEPSFWVSINPKPSSKRFDHVLIVGADQRSIVGDERERILVAIVGEITANGVSIGEHKFAKIKNGTSVVIDVPKNSVAIILTTRV